MLQCKKIATFHSPFGTKFGVPRQAGVVETLKGMIVLEEEYRNDDAIRGMECFDYLWLIWGFSANKHASKGLLVRPPRLGGNKHVGVFATRSPFRPNPLGLSSVRIDYIDYDSPDAPVIHVLGADLMDGTPIYDIKPYIPYTDAHKEAKGGFTDSNTWQVLDVKVADNVEIPFDEEQTQTLMEVLSQDPRPQYHNDNERVYGMEYGDYDVRFKVDGSTLVIIEINNNKNLRSSEKNVTFATAN